MDLSDAIQKLYAEKESLTKAIAALEALQIEPGSGSPPAPASSRRGRKSMKPEERQEVSLRMKKYWEGRRSPSSENLSS